MSHSVATFRLMAARNARSAVPGFANATTVSARRNERNRVETSPPSTNATAVALCAIAPKPRPNNAARNGLAVARCARRRIARDASPFRLNRIPSSPMKKKPDPRGRWQPHQTQTRCSSKSRNQRGAPFVDSWRDRKQRLEPRKLKQLCHMRLRCADCEAAVIPLHELQQRDHRAQSRT